MCLVLQLQDMKKALNVTYLVTIAADLSVKGASTEMVHICDGAEGLQEMLLTTDQSRYNSVAMQALYADQNAEGGIRR